MRARWRVELPSHDPDAAIIRACLGHLSPRRRTEMIRKLLAASCRAWLRARQAADTPTAATTAARRPSPPTPKRPRPVTPPAAPPADPVAPPADPAAVDHDRLTALAQRIRVPFISGGTLYDDTSYANHH